MLKKKAQFKMSIDGRSPHFVYLDSSYRNRFEEPWPGETEAKFMGGDRYTRPSDKDVILVGPTSNNNISQSGWVKSRFQYSPAYPILPANVIARAQYPYGPRYDRGIVFDRTTNSTGTATTSVILATDHINTIALFDGFYVGMYIEFYDQLNPNERFFSRIMTYTAINPFDPDPTGVRAVVELTPPVPRDLRGYLYSIRYGGLPVDSNRQDTVTDAGVPMVHGTITSATANQVVLDPGFFVSNQNNFYVGAYFLIVDTDDLTNYLPASLPRPIVARPLSAPQVGLTLSGFDIYAGTTANAPAGIVNGVQNFNRFSKITAYNPGTRTVTLADSFTFIPGPGCRYEILKLARPNEGALLFRGSKATNTERRVFDVTLIELSMPNIPDVFLDQHSDFNPGASIKQFDYFTVELTNENSTNTPDSVGTNSTNMRAANFMCHIREDNSTAFRTLLFSSDVHGISLSLTDTLRFVVRTPYGDILRFIYVDVSGDPYRLLNGTVIWDRQAPYPPDPTWQVSAKFALVPR